MGLKPFSLQSFRFKPEGFPSVPSRPHSPTFDNMPTPMKTMKAMKTGKPITKGAIAATLAAEFEIKQNVAGKIIASLAELGAKEVKKTGIFTFPGLVRIKTRVKPATKEIFGRCAL